MRHKKNHVNTFQPLQNTSLPLENDFLLPKTILLLLLKSTFLLLEGTFLLLENTSLAVFYLAEAPKDFDALKDFRRFPGTIGFRQPEKLKFEIRLANYRREVALDLMKDLYGKLKDFNHQIKITDDPEETGSKIRRILEMDITKQKALSTDYDAFKYWRI